MVFDFDLISRSGKSARLALLGGSAASRPPIRFASFFWLSAAVEVLLALRNEFARRKALETFDPWRASRAPGPGMYQRSRSRSRSRR